MNRGPGGFAARGLFPAGRLAVRPRVQRAHAGPSVSPLFLNRRSDCSAKFGSVDL